MKAFPFRKNSVKLVEAFYEAAYVSLLLKSKGFVLFEDENTENWVESVTEAFFLLQAMFADSETPTAVMNLIESISELVSR